MGIRSVEERIQELEAKIAAIRQRGERSKARRNPVVRPLSLALKSLDNALNTTDDAVLRTPLGEARTTVVSCLGLLGVTPRPAKSVRPRARKRRDVTAPDVLAVIREQGQASSESLAGALNSDAATLRPVIQQLIEEGAIARSGKARGTRYSTVG